MDLETQLALGDRLIAEKDSLLLQQFNLLGG